MATAGNIEAIRDWVHRYFYTKDEISALFTKLNDGLTAYKLTIVSLPNTEITINDNDQSNPQEYVIRTSSSGIYTGLFFFNEGNTLSLIGIGVAASHQLTEFIDTIYTVTIQELIPQMTSNTTPNTVGEVIYSSEYAGYPGFYAFDKNDGTRWNGSNNASVEYIGYRFFDKTCVAKIVFKPFYNSQTRNICFKHAYFQGSNDGVNWHSLREIEVDNTFMEYEFAIPFESSYFYYRLYCDDSFQTQAYSLWNMQLYGYQP